MAATSSTATATSVVPAATPPLNVVPPAPQQVTASPPQRFDASSQKPAVPSFIEPIPSSGSVAVFNQAAPSNPALTQVSQSRSSTWITGLVIVVGCLLAGYFFQGLRGHNHVSGTYITAVGAPRMYLNSDGTGRYDTSTAQLGMLPSPFDDNMAMLYQINGSHFHIDAIDPATGKAFRYADPREEAAQKSMISAISDGYISPDGNTIQVMGQTFRKQ